MATCAVLLLSCWGGGGVFSFVLFLLVGPCLGVFLAPYVKQSYLILSAHPDSSPSPPGSLFPAVLDGLSLGSGRQKTWYGDRRPGMEAEDLVCRLKTRWDEWGAQVEVLSQI